MSKPVQDVVRPPFTQVLSTIPSPLTITLVGLGPHIGRLRHALEIVSWKASWEESWLALLCWWALCLFSDVVLRYALPVILCTTVVILRWKPNQREEISPVTEDTLHQTMADLTTIHSLLPHLPPTLFPENVTLLILIRILAILYIPYLSLTYFVRLRVLVAIVGTLLFTWRARWALLIRRALWRSAYIRWATYLAWSRITGQQLPTVTSLSTTSASLSSSSSTSQQPVNSIRFLFTVFENQRWWVGLDFTAALLPGERPSWSTSTQQPVNPPPAFTLPAPTTVYLPDFERKGRRIKRTARWTWEESEWRVVVRREGSPSARVERPLPSLQDESAGVSASRLLKAAGKMRPASLSESSPERARKDAGGESYELEGKASDRDETLQEDPYTDADGWVYGDNKWEGGSAKGGIGKYTRYRRWTRVAVLTETIDYVEAGELGIRTDGSPVTSIQPLPTLNILNAHIEQPISLSPVTEVQGSFSSPAEDDRSRLRQRLKAAVRSGSLSIG